MKKLFIILSLIVSCSLNAQNVGIGTNTPSASAQLDVSSTNKGFLPPRLSGVQRDEITNPEAGLIIYCADCGERGEMQYYDGVNWRSMNMGVATNPVLPVVSTTEVTGIEGTTAVSGGTVSVTGGAAITARGVVWSTTPNPTVNLSTKTVNGSGEGVYASNITGLSPVTTYYVRAYATSSSGTAYGNELSFTTTLLFGSVTDIEGNRYKTIEIGTQTWMAENLRVTKYNNNSPIQEIGSQNSLWESAGINQIGALCSYFGSFNFGYGNLYNWYAVTNSNKLCPAGWHVPGDAEWTTLTNFLGGEFLAGGKMKSIGTELWATPNFGASNSSGFSGTPGGIRFFFGDFTDANMSGYWWSNTEIGVGNAWYRSLNKDNEIANRSADDKGNGMSVRCLKD